MVKNDRLSESYNEHSRRSQKYEADLSGYDEKQRKVVQKAIDSGVLNNTNRSHELVDLIAKISGDKDLDFDFTNNEKLKESGFALDGVTVNGFVNENGVTVNVNSAKALNAVVGHEITHVLEGTEVYTELEKALTEYAKGKNEYDTRLKKLVALYENVDGYKGAEGYGKIKKELIADLAGDYLFTDKEFVNRLSTEHRNVFQKIFDEVKYLCRVAAAGSKEARELERVKKVFEEVYRTETKNPTEDGGVRYSLSIKHTDGTVEVLADARVLTDEQAIGYLQQAKKGELRRDTYIPVRKDTPQVILDTLAGAGENVKNLSLVMQVRKAQQAMSSENSGNRSGKHGSNVRRHSLTPKEVVEIVNNLDEPSTVILQTNRQGKNGERLPNNVAVFVEYNKNGKEGVAVIEFESSINPEFIGTEFGDTSYHTVVTVFEPDVERSGVEFDYAEELLSNPDNRELEIVRKQPAGSATGEKHPNTSSELPSSNSIRNPNADVNIQNSLSEENISNDIAPLPGNIYGKDVALEENAPEDDIAPVAENATTTEMFPDDLAPVYNAPMAISKKETTTKAPMAGDTQRPAAAQARREVVLPTPEDIAKMEAEREAGRIPLPEDIALMEQRQAGMFPLPEGYRNTEGLAANGNAKGKQRKWVKTSTESDAVGRAVLLEDLDQSKNAYTPVSNKATLGRANTKLYSMGYDTVVSYFNNQIYNDKVELDDIAMGELLIQEAVKRGDAKTAGELMIRDAYTYASDTAKREYLGKCDVEYTNATKDGIPYYKENMIIGAIKYDVSVEEYELFSATPRKYALAQAVGGYERYKTYQEELEKLESDKDTAGKTVADSRKKKVIEYINNLDAEYGEKIILYVSEYDSEESRDAYGYDIVEYLNGRTDISYGKMEAILLELGVQVDENGRITW